MIFTRRHSHRRTGFTLVELLVTIAIIALLIGLAFKGVRSFREAAWKADTQNELNTIAASIQTYYSQFHAFPGPLPTGDVGPVPVLTNPIAVVSGASAVGFDTTSQTTLKNITASENLVLGLFGGLQNISTTATPTIQYDPRLVGSGAKGLNYQNPKQYSAFLDDQKLLSWKTYTNGKSGHYSDDASEASDSIIPELVDRFPQAMPILYLRANAGAQVAAPFTAASNNVITQYSYVPATHQYVGQYQVEQVIGYTGGYTGTWPSLSTAAGTLPPSASYHYIGEQRHLLKGDHYALNGSNITTPANPYHGLSTVKITATMTKGDTKFQYPYDSYPYFQNSTLSTPTLDVPRQKDGFILISPGADRIYGTEDDITSFGSVGGD
ncbi:MAG TPA: prepilin-type N-terminal cleavage/methylation domain-containing protein [Tepidisphaeraceae bacterium]|jgi:prepilin-type N-terminal cleavage/methylation domain-containing protein|nr:prepilin-type N-terminal cleavage/methylation domain-containing protein [Tepidisphaeraceae bacterium]